MGVLPPPYNRIDPYDFYVFTMDCTLWKFKKETDMDYHLVLRDDAGQTIISEIPHPGCVNDASLFKDYIISARDEFNAVYTPTSSFQTVNVPVTITGVAFFDFLHGQTGVAPNGIELHPVLDIQFTGSRQ